MTDSCLVDRRWAQILERFTSEHEGRFYTCVPLDSDPKSVARWYVDAVWFKTHTTRDVLSYKEHEPQFLADLSHEPEAILLSPRGYADRTAFGMLICARTLLPFRFPAHQLISLAAIVTERTPNTDWVYLRDGIELIEYHP